MALFRCSSGSGGSSGGIDISNPDYYSGDISVSAGNTQTINFTKTPKLIRILSYFQMGSGTIHYYKDAIAADMSHLRITRWYDNALNKTEEVQAWESGGGLTFGIYRLYPTSLVLDLTTAGQGRNFIISIWY